MSWADEVVVVDSGSNDRTCELATEFGAKVFLESWKGFSAQKNFAIQKATGDWILSLDADEEVSPELASSIREAIHRPDALDGYWMPRRNLFLGRWIKHGGFYPDAKLRLWKRGAGQNSGNGSSQMRTTVGPSVMTTVARSTTPATSAAASHRC